MNSLVCIGKLLEYLDKWIVLDDVLPILEKIAVRDSAILMAMLGIYKIGIRKYIHIYIYESLTLKTE